MTLGPPPSLRAIGVELDGFWKLLHVRVWGLESMEYGCGSLPSLTLVFQSYPRSETDSWAENMPHTDPHPRKAQG